MAAETQHRLESWKRAQKDKDALKSAPKNDFTAFAKYFKKLVRDQSVPEDIPWAVPWDELEKQKVKVPARVKRIRGKLNVPRERFRSTPKGLYDIIKQP